MIVRGLARVAAAWVVTYVLAFALAELAPGLGPAGVVGQPARRAR